MQKVTLLYISVFLCLCFLTPAAFGQIGPGGVGVDTTNLLWLRADAISGYSDGDPLDVWADTSGNRHHGEQSGTARPSYRTNVINGLPAVEFDGVDDYIDTLFNVPSRNMTIFTVFAHDHTGNSTPTGPLWVCDKDELLSGYYPMYLNGRQYLRYGSNYLWRNSVYTRNAWYLSTIERGSSLTLLRDNGSELQFTNENSIQIGDFTIAKRSNGQRYSGYISELVYFNYHLNTAERIIVENYLAAKYDLSIANDKYIYQGSHGHELAGIGRESASAGHTNSASGNILYMNNPSSLDDGDYLFWGHNDAALTFTAVEAPYSAVSQRLERTWRVNRTGDIGTVDMSIDTASLAALPAGFHEYVLYVDPDDDLDQDFSTGTVEEYTLSYQNGLLVAEDVSLKNGAFVTVGAIRPVQFELSTSRFSEGDATAAIVVSIPEVRAGDVSVDYAISSGTASEGIDYDLGGSGTATITAGLLTDTIEITIYDDNNTEGDETVILTLSNPINARLGTWQIHTLTIEDDDLFYTGPGGVGDSSTNRLWLRADDLRYLNDGDPVSTWTDTSGNNFDATQTGTARPVLVKDTLNGLPAVYFDGVDDYYDRIFSVQDKNMSVFTVFSHDHNGSTAPNGPLWVCDRDELFSGFYPMYSNGRQYLRYGAGYLQKPSVFNRNAWYSTLVQRGTNLTRLWIDGTNNHDINSNDIEYGDYTIARRSNGQLYRGLIAELIFYDYDLNEAQQIIVNNYLAAKYNMAIANDYYAFDAQYGHEMAGIGRVDVSNVHTIAQSAGILQFGNATDLDDNEFLMFGHNGAALDSFALDTATGGYRLNRFWRLDMTGDVGYVAASIDTTLLPEPPPGLSDYVLWVYGADTTAFVMGADNGNFSADSVVVADGDSVSIGMVNTVQFATTTSGGAEGIADVTIIIAINDTMASDVTVDYAVSGSSTATGGGTDYSLAPTGTRTIPAGEIYDTLNITIVEDTETETEETIVISLSNPSGAVLGARSTHTYTISDNDFGGITGPAGVGDASSNELWLRAQDIGLNANDPVVSWNDTSGNLYHASQSNSTWQPSFKTNVVNGFPAVRFDGIDDHLDDIHAYNANTVFIVFNTRGIYQEDVDMGQLWGNYDDDAHIAADARDFWTAEQGFSFDGGGNSRARYGLNGDDYGGYNEDDNTNQWRYDTFEIVSVEFENQQNMTRQVIGSLHPAFDEDLHNFGGDISEIIVYNKALNSAQKILIENYLANKYDRELTQNDYYAYEATNKYGLVGIGRTDASNFHTAAESSKIIKISNASSLGDGDFLLFAHDNGSFDSCTTNEIPSDISDMMRIEREWRIDETGDVGNITVSVDTTYLPSRPEGYTECKLMVDADGDFTTGAVLYTLEYKIGTAFLQVENIDIPDGYYIAIAVQKPTVQFEFSQFEGYESDTLVDVNVMLNRAVGYDITFDISDAGTGTATDGGVDYETVPVTPLTISAGDTMLTFQLEIIDDATPEGDETIALYLSNVDGAVIGSRDTVVYTIHDNDYTRDLQFFTPDSTIDEGIDSMAVIVELSQPDGSNPITVDMIFSGTATGDSVDYDTLSTTFVIPAGDSLDTLYIPIIDDVFDEDAETIKINLTNPTNANLGSRDSLVLTIQDNDLTPTIQFLNAAVSVSETDGSVNLEVALSDYSGKTVTADYTVASGSAVEGVDFNLAGGQVSIGSGDYNTFVVPDIINDAEIETPETFTISLSNPSNATIGVNEDIKVTIVDDDIASFSYVGPAGIGNYANNKLWFKADSLELSDGDTVSVWNDVSGNAYDALQANASRRPIYEDNEINGFPVVRFDGVDDFLTDTTSYTGRDVYAVFRMSSADQGTSELAQIWGNYQEFMHVAPDPRSGGNNRGYSFDGQVPSTTLAQYGHNGEDYGPLATDTDDPSQWTYDDPYIVSVRFEQGQAITRQVLGSLWPEFDVGIHQLGGDVAEIIVFNSTINDAQKIIVENYLSSKYDIALDQNDYYNHDVSGTGTHYYDVAGIGQVDASNRHITAQSAGLLRIFDTAGLDDNEFLIYGHDNARFDTLVATETPVGQLRRMPREWRVTETGDLGVVDVYLDTALLPDIAAGFSQVEVWIDADGDFTAGPTRTTMTLSGGEYYAPDVAIADGDYLSFGFVPIEINVLDTLVSGLEDVTPARMVIALSQTSPDTVKIDYATSAISATPGVDYIEVSGTAVFNPGQLYDTVEVTINDDATPESNERFEILFSNPFNALLGADTTYIYTILDNDGKGYEGPGGVANLTSDINVWLDTEFPNDQHANATGIGAENTADEWKDVARESGDSLDAFQDNTNNQPAWYTTSPVWNDRPVIQFDGNNDHLNIANNALMNTATLNRRFFMIAFKTGPNVSDNRVIYEEGGATRGFNFYIEDDSLYMGGWDNNIPWVGESGDDYIYNAKEVQPNTGYFAFFEYDYDGSNGYIKGHVNGEEIDSVSGPGEMASHTGDIEFGYGDCCFKGIGNCSGEGRFDGQLAEFISGQMMLNNTQRNIIANYMAAKYGITLTGTPDMYDYESAYSYRVIGIGQESDADNHFVSQGRDVIKISNPTDIDDGEYLFAGNNNGDISTWTQTGTPNPDVQRLSREWRVDLTGDPGEITLAVDSAGIPALLAGFDNYMLMVDADGDFTSGASIYPLTANGAGYYEMSGLALSSGDYLSIVAVNNNISFANATSSGNEGDGGFDVRVVMNVPSASPVSVDFNTYDMTASATQVPVPDYVDTTGTLVIPAGDTAAVLHITVNNETKRESDETFGIALSNPIGGYDIGTDTNHVRTIFDDDILRKVRFLNAGASGNESTSPLDVEIRLTENNPDNPSTVDYEILSSGTAGSDDYSLDESGTVYFATNNQIAHISFPVIDDNFNEPDETIIIRLLNPVNANMGSIDTFTYTIIDNDPVPTITFDSDTISNSEGVVSREVQVFLSEQSGYDVTFDYHADDLTATGGGTDYTLSDGTVTIPAGDTTGSFTILMTDDGAEEANEFIKIYFDNPAYANVGAIDTTYFIIIDNDGKGFDGPGGVGNFTGQINCWLNTYLSDELEHEDVVKGAASPERWIDQTGNDIDAYQDNAANQPTFYRLAPTWNGNPVIDFESSSNHFLEIADNEAMNDAPMAQTERTIMAVFRTGGNIEDRQIIYEEGGGARGLNIYIQEDTLYLGAYNDAYNRFWNENFNGDSAKGWRGPDVTDLGGISKWSGVIDFDGLADANDWFYVYNNRFTGRDVSQAGEEQVWQSEQINTSNYIEESFEIDLDAQDLESNDTIKIFYSVDGGPEQLSLDTAGDFSSFTHLQTGIAEGDSLQIIVKVKNDEDDDYHFFDNVDVFGNPDDDPRWQYKGVKKKIDINSPYVALLQWDFDDTGNGVAIASVNGEIVDTITGAYRLFPHPGDIGIGGMNGGACFLDPLTQEQTCGGDPSYFGGYYGEFVSANIVYNSAQQKIIDNYLAAKYSYTLSGGKDLYDYELGYHNELIGIGQDSVSSFHLAAKGSGLVKIQNPSNVGDGKYLFTGHDNDSIERWVNSEVPNDDENIQRVLREWRVDKQGGDIGATDLHFDTSALAPMPSGYSDYIIMVDADGDFSSGATVTKLTDNGDGYFVASGINFNKGDYFTVGVIQPAVKFSLAASGGPENIDEFIIDIELNYKSSIDIQVDYQSSDSTAEVGQVPTPDYNELSGTLTIPAGDLSASVTLEINNDLVVENDEQLLITLSNPSAGVAIGADTTHTFTIQDDDQSRKVQFTDAESSGPESNDSVYLHVELSEPNAGGETTVEYKVVTSSSTATEDSVDYYVPMTDTLVFPVNVTDTSILLTVINDLSNEYDETVAIELYNPISANLGFNTIHTYTIEDDDPAPTVGFALDSVSGMESISPVELMVILSVKSGREITVDYEAYDIDAQGASVDYQLDPGTLTFPAGTDTVYLPLYIFNDRTEEDNEDLGILLKTPVNATLSTKDTLRYKILDDDGLGIDGPGGVGSTENQVDCWLRSNNMPDEIFDGVEISTTPRIWTDITGHGLEAYQTDAGNRPMYWDGTASWFGKPVIEFERGNEDYLEIANNPYMNTASGPQNQRTIIVAFRPTNNINDHQVVYEEGGGARGLSIYIMNDSVYIGGWNYPDDQGAADPSTPWGYVWVQKEINVNTPYFAILQFNFDDAGVGTVSGYLNGENLGFLPGAGRLYPHGGGIGIGGPNGSACYHFGCGGGGSFEGYISEFMSGNMVYNAAQSKLVNNYFAAKYNVILPGCCDDLYDYHVEHGDEVFGIGQVSNAESHYISQGQGPVKIENPSDAANGKYLLIGNDVGDLDDWYDHDDVDVPDNSENIVRVEREWRVDKQGGDIGDIDLSIEAAKLPTKTFGFPTYILMIDTNDGDFTDCNIFYELSDNGDGFFKVGAVDFAKGDYFTIGLVKPTVQFADTAYNAFETDTGYVQASLNFIPGQTYTVDYITNAITAIANTDYDSVAGTLNFTAGTRTIDIAIPLIDDLLPENNETFSVTLYNTQGDELIIGEDSTTIFTILDDDNTRKINFARADSADNESETSIDIKVLLSERDDLTETKVYYSVTGGTATGSGTDFTLAADTLRFATGDTLEYITLAVNDDALDEYDETVIITLSGPLNGNIGDTSVFTYTIIDDDPAPVVQFSDDTLTGAESYSPAGFEVILSAVSGRDITVDYTTSDITAIGGGIDYEMADGETRTLTIPAGTDTTYIYVDVVNDLVDEPTKMFRVHLDNPSFASIGSKDTAYYNIIDDDGLGYTGPGGIGSNAQYKLWYYPLSESYSNGDPVDLLTDYSNNANNASSSGGERPTFNTNAINGRPIVSFDGSNAMDIADSDDLNTSSSAQTERTFVVAFRTGADIGTRQVIYEEGGTGRGLCIYVENDSLYWGGWNLAEDNWGFTHVTAPVASNTEYYAILEMNATDTLFRGWMNGTFMGSKTDVNALYSHGGDIRFGANESAVYHDGNSSSDHYFTGDVMQFLSYNYRINTAQQKILENYFAAEFRNRIETDLSADLYDYRGTHGHEVFGLGQDDLNNNHTVTRGTGIVRIDQPVGLGNNEFLLTGHDNAGAASWTSNELAIDSMYRIAQEWRVTLTGNPGAVRISVDTTGVPVKPDNYNLYALMVDSDGDFTSGDEVIYPLYIRSGNYVMNSGITFQDGDHFTIVVGRNRTIASGNWNDPTIWLKGEVPAVDDEVLISVGDTVDVTSDVEIGAVEMDSASIINITGSHDFDISEGDLVIDPDAQLNPNSGKIIYSAHAPQCIAGMTYYDLWIRGTGAKTLCGDITVTNFFEIFQDAPTLSLDVTASNYTITLNCDWRNSGTFIPQDGVVILDGGALEINRDNNGPETFNKLDVQTTTSLTLRDHVYVADTLFMNGSNINTAVDTLSIGTGAGVAGEVVRNSGVVLGTIQRWIDNTTDEYMYPIGTSTSYRPMSIHANTLATPGYAIGRFVASNPGTDGLATIYEDSLYMVNTFTEGYWSLISNGMASNDYDVDVEATGFSSVDALGAGTRLLTRPNSSSDWTLDGDHVNASGATIQRDNVTTLAAQFAVCDTANCMPNTSDITGNDTVCENVTGEPYSVINSIGSSYTWIIAGGTQASGTNTNSITVDWGAATNGNIKVVEDNGCAIGDTVNMDVLVRPYPADPGPITGPDTIVEGIDEVFSIADVANATSYTWSIPVVISGDSDSTEITLNADVGSGGSDYTIEVVGANACGNSATPVQKSIFVAVGVPAKPTTPTGPTELCQDSPDTVYSTTTTLRATSYEWDLIDGGTSVITGTDTAGTLDMNATYNGSIGIAVRGVNANGNGSWSDTLSVTIHEQPNVLFTVVAGFDTICNGSNTLLEVDFTAGQSPWDFDYTDGTNSDSETNIAADPYQFTPTVAPAYGGVGKMTDYTYTITSITDNRGCTNTAITGPDVSIVKRPETGSQHYVPPDFNE